MEGVNADNVRPPTQTRTRSTAQTVHAQAPTTQSEVQSKNTWGSSDTPSDGDEEGSNQSSNKAEHEDTACETQAEKEKDKENQFLSKPETAQQRGESRTPARDRPEPLKEKALVRPLRTEGLEAMIEHQKKDMPSPKPKPTARQTDNQRQRKPQDRRRDPSAPKRIQRHQDHGARRSGPSARKRDPSARKKRNQTPSPQHRERAAKGTLAPVKTAIGNRRNTSLLATAIRRKRKKYDFSPGAAGRSPAHATAARRREQPL